MEIDHEIFSMVILLLLIQEGLLSCSYKRKYVHEVLVNRFVLNWPMKKVWRLLTDHLDMTIAVDSFQRISLIFKGTQLTSYLTF